jgi:hypothetical protein
MRRGAPPFIKPGPSTGRIPANVLVNTRASVTAGYAKEGEAVLALLPVDGFKAMDDADAPIGVSRPKLA